MIEATRSWFRRNRARFAISLGILGGGYLLVQYVLGKIVEARERMSSDRIARENLRRRFRQNQEDCTFTVLALLPTVAENILEALPVENITRELQQQRAEKLGRSAATSEISPSEFSNPAKSIAETSHVGGTQDGRQQEEREVEQTKQEGDRESEQEAARKDDASTTASTAIPAATSPQQEDESKSQGEVASQSGESFVHTSQMGQSVFAAAAATLDEPPAKRKTKVQLWNELKIQAVVRTFTMVYTLGLLTLFTRVQLNLLGRRSYLSSVVSLATSGSPPPAPAGGSDSDAAAAVNNTINLENHDDDRAEASYGSDFETNRKFLTFSWWILNRGWREVRAMVEQAVVDVFTPVNVRDDVPLERLAQLVVDVRKRVEGATEAERRSRKWLPYVLPPAELESFVLTESGVLPPMGGGATSSVALATPSQELPTPPVYPNAAVGAADPLRRLLDETSDLLDSPTASHIMTLLLDALFSQLTDVVLRTQAFKLPPLNQMGDANPAPGTAPFDPSQRVVDISDPRSPAAQHFAAAFGAGGTGAGDARAKLATILAVLTRQGHALGSGVPNEYVQAMEGVRELEAFAAVVYSSNFELEGMRAGQEEEELEEDRRRDAENAAAAVVAAKSSSSSASSAGWGWNPLGWVFGGSGRR